MSGTCTGFYNRVMAPRFVDSAYRTTFVTEQRRRVVPAASGIVVEIGIGTGLNLPLYDAQKVSRLIGIDPAASMLKLGQKRAQDAKFDIEILQESAGSMSLDSNLADTVLVTYSLCSIKEVVPALAEMRRILKPDGRMLFCEHGRAHSETTAKWQDRINPAWRALSGGCNLNRNIFRLVQNSGFQVEFLDTYSPPMIPSLFGFHYVGTASIR